VPSALAERLRRHVVAQRLFPKPGLALLAVSGGADSLALLDLLARLGPELGLALAVAHADHGIDPGSAVQAERVRDLVLRRYGLDVVVARLGLGPDASETRARTARYRFLRSVQTERGARYLLTAHHADDQIETVLLRLLRGSAPAGLAGIPASGPRGLVRPLLPFGRDELRAHVLAVGLEPAEDPANADPRHLRSWVRTVLVPAIEARLGAAAPRALLDAAAHARVELRAWDAALDHLPGLDVQLSAGRFDVARDALASYDKWLAERVLRAVAARSGVLLTPRGASGLAAFARSATSGRRLALPGGLTAEATFGRLAVSRPEPVPEAARLTGAEGACEFGRHRLAWRGEAAPSRIERAGWTTWLAPGGLELRGAMAGDRLLPLGGVGRRPVSRLLMEAKVPRGDRAGYPLVVAAGEVAWVPGVCRGAAAVPPPGSAALRVDVTVR
jgi:tRNA(Ile)-lysidine synthase